MAQYDYIGSMVEDIIEWFKDNPDMKTEDYDKVFDILWTEDSVTGNASGSYTFNRFKAQEYVKDNFDLLIDACDEFDIDNKTLGEKIRWSEWEWADVTIRCSLLGKILSDVMDSEEFKEV